MHPLIPDDYAFHSAVTGRLLEKRELHELSGRKTPAIAERLTMADLFYSFGTCHPGAVTLHNYPRHLQNLTRDDGEHLDLAAVDILRDRERGVPRYNQFRRLLHKDPVKSFDELTDNPAWRKQLREVYGNDLEKVDLMTGLYAEPLPPGFGFSETAFRIFILMASRRLKSDRFFTDDFRPEVYTEFGIDYVRRNSMLNVVRRHYPQLGRSLEGVKNAFAPWKQIDGPAGLPRLKSQLRLQAPVLPERETPNVAVICVASAVGRWSVGACGLARIRLQAESGFDRLVDDDDVQRSRSVHSADPRHLDVGGGGRTGDRRDERGPGRREGSEGLGHGLDHLIGQDDAQVVVGDERERAPALHPVRAEARSCRSSRFRANTRSGRHPTCPGPGTRALRRGRSRRHSDSHAGSISAGTIRWDLPRAAIIPATVAAISPREQRWTATW